MGFKLPTPFKFPHIPVTRPTFKSILEAEPDPKYTLTPHLWNYLKGYAAKHKAAGNGFGYGMTYPDDPGTVSRTLSARYYKDGSEILIYQGEGKVPRRLTPRECARLMGFPDDFEIPVSDTRAYKQFGNSVVVPVVEAVAREIVKWLRPRQIELAPPPLPAMARLLDESQEYVAVS